MHALRAGPVAAKSITGCRRAFTLAELLVAMTVLLVLTLMMVTLTNQSNRIWQRSRARIDTFQSARNAFEALTTNLNQATLNTYLDYYDSSGHSRGAALAANNGSAASFVPSTYDRASDLQFICAPAATLFPTAPAGTRPTHAVFYQAPLGHVTNPTSANNDFKNLSQVLNAVGYYIQFSDDSALRPAFITSAPVSWRYRLMELNQPSQSLGIYAKTPAFSNPGSWFSLAVDPSSGAAGTPAAGAPVVTVADNIVALILRPKLPSTTAATAAPADIAPNYAYDTKASQTSNGNNLTLNAYSTKASKNQLPPLVQVTLVAIDANSAAQLANQFGTTPPSLFGSSPFTDVTQYDSDMAALQTVLQNYRLNYRVFTSDVGIPGAKWSQTN